VNSLEHKGHIPGSTAYCLFIEWISVHNCNMNVAIVAILG